MCGHRGTDSFFSVFFVLFVHLKFREKNKTENNFLTNKTKTKNLLGRCCALVRFD